MSLCVSRPQQTKHSFIKKAYEKCLKGKHSYKHHLRLPPLLQEFFVYVCVRIFFNHFLVFIDPLQFFLAKAMNNVIFYIKFANLYKLSRSLIFMDGPVVCEQNLSSFAKYDFLLKNYSLYNLFIQHTIRWCCPGNSALIQSIYILFKFHLKMRTGSHMHALSACGLLIKFQLLI